MFGNNGAGPRGLRGGKRLEMDNIRRALLDQRIWCSLGVVQPQPGESHFIIVPESDTESADVLIEVQLSPGREQLLCRLGSFAGGPGGIWRIPPIGTEVAVLIPTGEFEADPILIGTLSTGVVPAGLTGDTIVVMVAPGAEVIIHDGDTGGLDNLVKRSEFNSHTHDVPNASPIGSPPVTAVAPDSVPGTQVLRSK